MTRSVIFELLVACTLLAASPAVAQTACNPLVSMDVTEASLAKTLGLLSVEYGFELSFPHGVDRAVSINDQMPLNQLVEKITRGTSTSLIYREEAGCAQQVLVRVVVYPQGEQVDASLPEGNVDLQPEPAPAASGEYIYIDNMEQYVEEVIFKKRKPQRSRMTPQQAAEFREVKRRLKKTLKQKYKAEKLKRRQSRVAREAAAGTAGTVDQ
ncbi:MAG: hypothetical protein WBN57_02975 [Gammaproteobacteria bacterium]